MPKYFLAFDVGTSGVKAGVVTEEGAMVATSSREYPSIYPGPQWVEQSVDTMWLAQCEASKRLLATSGIKPAEIAGVAVSSQRATFVPVGRNEEPLTNFIGWQDKRSIKQCEFIRQAVGNDNYYQISGLSVEPTAAVSKILWLKENQPEVFDQTHKFYSTQNMHLHQLGVRDAPCDLPDASYMGLLDASKLEWSQTLLDILEIPAEKMPSTVPSCELVGTVSGEAAQATGIREGTPLITAGGDAQVGALGLGMVEPGTVCLAIGTGAGILFYLDEPLLDPNGTLSCLAHAVPGAWEMEGLTLAAGGAHKWFRDVLSAQETEAAKQCGIAAFDILNLQASAVPPGSHGLIVMPCLAGAGAPYWYPQARGVIMGLTLGTQKSDLARAMMEGIALELGQVFEAAKQAGAKVSEVRLFGGASKSPIWNQILADVFGVPVRTSKVQDAGLIGASICAGIGVGAFKDAQEGTQAMVQLLECYEPNLSNHALYSEIAATYHDAFRALKDAGVFERMARLALS